MGVNNPSRAKLDNAILIYKQWKETPMSAQDAWYEITGVMYSEDTARKYLNGLKVFLDSGKGSRLAGTKIENKLIATKNKDGNKIYTHTSSVLVEIQNLQQKTPDEIMLLHGYDPIKWELEKNENKIWNGASKDQGTYTLYSNNIRVKPTGCEVTFDYITNMFAKLKVPELEPIEYKNSGDKLLEIPIVDLHLGKLAWALESGEDYDLKIAGYLFKETIENIISRIDKRRIDRIVFPIGQDFFNSDNSEGKTTKGTNQDMDSRWEKIFQAGFMLNFWAIEHLRKIAPVDVFYVPGNHDYTNSYFLVHSIKCQYHDVDGVNVDISPKFRKYYKYGKCMIGFAHGEEPKKNLVELMQAESPEMWGETKYREFHLGHLHSQLVEEHLGFIIRRISAITRSDAWHTKQGYLGAVKQAQAFVWDKEKGLEQIINSIVENEGD